MFADFTLAAPYVLAVRSVLLGTALCLASAASSKPLLLLDQGGMKIIVDDKSPCTSEAFPIILDSQVTTQFDESRGVWDPLWLARMKLDYAGICRFGPGDWIVCEGRVRSVPVRRGLAEIEDDMSWTGQIDIKTIPSILPPDTSLSAILSGRKRTEPLPIDELVALYDTSNDPAERREIAYLIGQGATVVSERSQAEQDRLVSFLELAAKAGHPVAMFMMAQLAGLPEFIYEATANVATSAVAHEKLDAVLPTAAGTYIFQSAEANYLDALKTLQRAETFGLIVNRDGVILADTPTLYNMDAAVNAHLQERSLGNLVPGGLAIQSCDGTWCHVIGGSKFRITVDGVACDPTGEGAASCLVTARFILTNDFGDDTANWQKQFMSLTTNAAPFRFAADLVADKNSWKIVKMQGNN